MSNGQPARALTLGFLLLTFVGPLSAAQTGERAGATGRTGTPIEAVIYVQDLTPGEQGNRIRDVLVTRIAGKFAAFGLHEAAAPVLVEGPGSEGADIRVQPLLAQRVAPAADLVVAAIFRIQSGVADIQFILLDPKQRTVLGGVLSRARTGLTVLTSVDAAVNDLDPVLQRYRTNRYEYHRPEGVVESIILTGTLEGEEVFFAGRDVGRISGGVLTVPYTPFPVGQKVRAELRKPGYHSEEIVIDLPSSRVTTSIPPLKRAHRFSAGLQWVFGQALGYGITARAYAIPDWTFLEVNAYRDLSPKVRPEFHDQRHYDFGASIGQYLLLSYRSPVRVAVRLGAGVIFTSFAGLAVKDFADVYLNIVSPTVEFQVGGWQLYLQPELKFTVGAGDNLLGRSWIATSAGLPPISIGVLRAW